MNIIVTGASQGIGYEIVKNLSVRGNHKILAVARNREALNELAITCNETSMTIF